MDMSRAIPSLVFILCAVALGAIMPAPKAQAAGPEDAMRATGLRVLGATRGYATAALWLRAGDAYRRGDYFETQAMYQLIREMQPRNPAVYSYLSWNEGYNIPGQFPDRARQLPWLARGLQTIHEGQRELPFDASLRLEEWHFVFNRTRDFPLEVLRLELEAWHEREPAWAAVVKSILASQDALTQARRDQLDAFPDQAVLPADLQDLLGSFDELDAPARAKLLDPAFDQLSETEQGSLGTDFDLVARQQLRAFLALDREVQVIVALANWARLHLMCAALEPVLNMKPRSLSADAALLNSYLYAQKNLPLGMEEAFTPRYRAGVKAAFAAGRALARAAYGEEGAEEFSVRMKENFNSLPGWLE
ncbi:MAG: hypothetical protein HPKKFMNG_02858 [Planctomycetes bacterium]|nr:hypothetical protein [Planctomycetota bacterium]GIK52126.1 MAG: hypothetical protein BroJett014_10990 [Planctomycetota bacterium]